MNDAEREAEEVCPVPLVTFPLLICICISLEQERYREVFYILSYNLPVNTDPFLELFFGV